MLVRAGANSSTRALLRSVRRTASSVAARTQHQKVTHPENEVSKDVQEYLDTKARYLLPVYARPPIVLERGKGMYVWDTEGRKYLDFSAGIAVNSLGHADEELAKIMQEQASTLLHSSNVYYNKWAGILAERLVKLTGEHGGLGIQAGEDASLKVFFASTGTEANEGALKIARKIGKDRWAMNTHGRQWQYSVAQDISECTKVEIVCFENGFHGRSMGALSVTSNPKYQKPFGPLIPGIKVGKLNENASMDLITCNTCAVIVEPIQGEGGIHTAEEQWLRGLRKKCNEMGAVLIYDEIQCGLFRTGPMWAHGTLPPDCHPDIVTMAKPLANGYPIGAVLMRDEIGESMGPGSHGTTFGGSPLACRLGAHTLGRLADEEFQRQVRKNALHLSQRLERLAEMFPGMIGPIRGRGLLRGIPFIRSPSESAGRMVGMARERGVLLLTAGVDAVRLVPSLVVSRDEIDLAVDTIETCIGLLAASSESEQ